MLIGIAGPARAGKDTAADLLLELLPGSWQKLSFATPMKRMLAAGFGLSECQLYGEAKDREDSRYGCSPRHMLQTLGTEWGRKMIGEDVWVAAMAKMTDWGNHIIPDVRFANEAELIRSRGVLIHVKGRMGIESGHASEAGVSQRPGDYVVWNDGTIADYRAELVALVGLMFGSGCQCGAASTGLTTGRPGGNNPYLRSL